MPFRIVSPSATEHCYQYTIEGAAFPVEAYLTYQINKAAPATTRTILLTDARAASELLNHVSAEERGGLDTLHQILDATEARGPGAIESVKTIVNRLHAGELAMPHVAVAVHRHGPVPVYLLNDTHDIEVHSDPIACRIGIYPGFTNPKTLLPRGVADNTQLLESFQVGLDLMLRRYLEDIAEYLFDIEHHSDLSKALHNGKSAERVLGESIEAKLSAILHPRRSNVVARAEALTEELLRSYGVAITTARYARVFVLTNLQRFYRAVGIEHDVKKYTTEFSKVAADRIRRIPKLDWRGQTAQELPVIRAMALTLDDLASSSDDSADQITRRATQPELPTWLGHFLMFAAFVKRLEHHAADANVARLFLSRHFDIETAERFFTLAVAHVDEQHAGKATIVSRRSTGGGELRRQLRTDIWASDVVGVVVPARAISIAGTAKDGMWLAREVEHAFLLERRLIPFLEEGSDRELFADMLENVDEYLSPRARRPGDWKERIKRRYRDVTSVQFLLTDAINLPPQISRQIDVEVRRAREKRVFKLIVGLFLQLDKYTRKQLLRMESLTRGKPFTSRELGRILFRKSSYKDGARRFRQLWTHAKERRIIAGGKTYSLMSQSQSKGNTYYRIGLADLVKQLLPESADADVSRVVADIMTAVRG